ncbi:hypothetical protein GXW74_08785 [Roseomonas eburnea]|uniref:Uncharacterized protein n=1 Tax=Neoroseomonas eburnea TaxID=1346889 RepID=A0A9X9XA44_9PROT|nr:hypothetical protein [Neoroseomonas eburnea]MBR0680580.1 hypothetical protein [Neoroseomonas eburnea]
MRHAILLLVLLGGCEAIDPYTRAGNWRPLHANEANLRVHVADPAMLDRGIDDPRSDGQVAAAAVHRHRNDRLRALPASGVARLQASGQGGAAGAATGGGDGGR